MGSLILHGRRFSELQKLRILRFAVNPFQNASAFSNSFSSKSVSSDVSSRDGQKGRNFTVSYLVGSLGLATKLAESISKKVTFENKANPDSVLSLLRSHGFKDSQISDIITDYPLLLIADAEKSLAPKLRFLQSRGASNSELTEIVSTVPKMLGKKGERSISLYYDIVKEIIEADKSSKRASEAVIPLAHLQIAACKWQRKVVEMGFDPTTFKFVDALRMLQQMSDKTIQEKVQVYKELGFAVGETWEIFKKCPTFLKYSESNILSSMETFLGLGFSRDEFVMIVKYLPQCIGYSSETVKEKTEFVVKQMNWPLKAVASFPAVLGYSMEKRIVPRSNVIKALMSKELLGKRGSELPAMSTVFAITDQDFLNKYVRDHDDDKELVAELMAIFTRGRVS
ncbi:unnamed protein product [Microthlaspi erraticum]|uniref:Mitochondrial transcription termination factor family protein n=1 Tax=Microthlaspi erraticum TaxID=1685480 RepID=A0A6D2IN66_9BRAS|nr:unnamed protein product [Microthlaspi erraticum]